MHISNLLYSPHFSIFTVKPLTVNIINPPSPLVADRRYEVHCESSGSRPNAIITWYKGKRQLKRTKVSTKYLEKRYPIKIKAPIWWFWCFGTKHCSRLQHFMKLQNCTREELNLSLCHFISFNGFSTFGSWQPAKKQKSFSTRKLVQTRQSTF